MDTQIRDRVFQEFAATEREAALAELASITRQHVMAGSPANLRNTWLAILKLSHGNLERLKALVAAAKQDFRDVIYWAGCE